MLSQKYYKKLAEIFTHGYNESYKNNALITGKIENSTRGCEIVEMQDKLLKFLREDNPKFDEDKFRNAIRIDFKALNKWLDTE